MKNKTVIKEIEIEDKRLNRSFTHLLVESLTFNYLLFQCSHFWFGLRAKMDMV